jgi:phage protein U
LPHDLNSFHTMPNNRLGENSQYKGMLSGQLTVKGKVFVTGNANKLKEVQTILSEGHPLAITSQNFDSKLSVSSTI